MCKRDTGTYLYYDVLRALSNLQIFCWNWDDISGMSEQYFPCLTLNADFLSEEYRAIRGNRNIARRR